MDLLDSLVTSPSFKPVLLTASVILIYSLYVWKFKFYNYLAKELFGSGRKVRGKNPPFYPNGWYRLARITEIVGQKAFHFEQCGRQFAVYRGEDGKVYCMDAFCPHMGANLGMGGTVEKNCVKCPFHGFLFEGKTGQSVYPNGSPKPLTKCEYQSGVKTQTKNSDGLALVKKEECVPKLKTYHIREVNNEVLVWIHSRDEPPHFEPFNCDQENLIERGEGVQYVNCQISEIPENGADIKHFEYIHLYVTPLLKFMTFKWEMKSMPAASPELSEHMKHEDKGINQWKQNLFSKYINEDNSKFINILGLDAYLVVFGREFYILNVTGFQVGPSLVHLFFNFRNLFYAAIFQSVTPVDKFMQRVINRAYVPKWIPYSIAAAMLRTEMSQVTNDLIVWNNKNFADTVHYNFTQDSEVILYKWRNWYSQFYDGCHEKETNLENLNW